MCGGGLRGDGEALVKLHEMIEKAERVLREYSLCSSCLGRLFSKYGVGLTNWDRGIALKTMLAIKLYFDYNEKRLGAEDLRKIAVNAGESVLSMYRKLSGEVEVTPARCYVCSGQLTHEILNRIASDVCEELSAYSARTFLIGVMLSKDIVDRELEVVLKYGLSTAESVKREIKREVGKLVKKICQLEPSFERADVVAIIHLDRDFNYSIEIRPAPIYIKGLYWKLGRRVSHVPWYTREGLKKYPLSVQEAAEAVLLEVFNAKKVVIHAAGREDVDARMLGTGRPLVIEVKEPRIRNAEIPSLNALMMERLRNSPVRIELAIYASKRDVRLIKELSKRKRKVYRIVVYSPQEPINPEELRYLEEYFKNRIVKQLTPIRVLRRKKERGRIRRVYDVKTIWLTPRIFEALVYCDGGLYVKELVHCDQGRTTPCFAGVLGRQVYPVELDVLNVEE